MDAGVQRLGGTDRFDPQLCEVGTGLVVPCPSDWSLIAAAIALLLSAVGLYGVLSYAVSLRTREIGVRIALGAPPARVKRTVMKSAAIITAIGLAIGSLGAFGLTRFLRGLLYETEPLDLPTFGAMAGVLFLVGLLAAYLPARKAASVSPLEAMRTD